MYLNIKNPIILLMKITHTKTQKSVASHKGHCLMLGAAGTGKTTALLARAAELIKTGVPPRDIAVLAFSYRSAKLLERIAGKRYDGALAGVNFATFLDFAGAGIPEGKKLATNTTMRNTLKKAMVEAKFTGSLREAEHIIRTFKGRSKKPQENEAHYLLLQVYKKMMDDAKLVDRNDVIRGHILGLRKGTIEPHPIKHLLVDNLQDASQIQLIWLQEQLVDATLCGAINDDVTLFGLDGALSSDVMDMLNAHTPMELFKLEQNFRTPKDIHGLITKPARQLKQRLQKQDAPQNNKKAAVHCKTFSNEADEHAFVVKEIQEVLAKSPKARVGVVVRHDYLANRLIHACHKAGLRPATYARSIWDKPGAGTVMAMLYLIMGQSSGSRFERFLATHLGAALSDKLIKVGMTGEEFLRTKDLPQEAHLNDDERRAFQSLQRRVKGYVRLLQVGQVDPRDVFKATVADTLPKLSAEEQEDAMLAVRILLTLKGRLAELLPRLETETLPDMTSNVIITPIRETRNMEFDALFMPHMQEGVWPPVARSLKVDLEHERRLFVQAMSRTKGNVTLTHHTADEAKGNLFFREMS